MFVGFKPKPICQERVYDAQRKKFVKREFATHKERKMQRKNA
jgi:hypothetical protein